MKCHFCATGIRVADPRAEVWAFPSPDGIAEKVFGPVPGADGPLGTPCWNLGGTLSRAYHRKCFLAERRRRQLRSADASAQPPEDALAGGNPATDVEELSEGNGDC